ncbi:MAG TPA: Trp biosynthesis-associated membrane protein, partial [Streptosporangiaceae bacterium]
VLLVTRQELAKVVVRAPRPLPDSVTTVSAQDVRPAIAALALAALASLAAVLATRGLLRRLTGILTVALGAGVAATAFGPVTAAAALAAASRAGASPASGSGAGTAAGSVTAGSGGPATPGTVAGFPVHVVLTGTGWRALMIVGAVLIVAAGLAVVTLARRLPVMSGRYERRSAPAAPGQPARPGRPRAVAASMWESLNAGADPTAGPD